MPVYRVIRKSDKKTVYAYNADAPVEFPELPFSEFDHIEEVEINENGSIDATHGVRITRLAFRNRFTPQEKATIEFAALDDPQAPIEQRHLVAMLRAFLDDVQSAEYIDLDDQFTRAGVMYLEQIGLLSPGRANEILDTPPTSNELAR